MGLERSPEEQEKSVGYQLRSRTVSQTSQSNQGADNSIRRNTGAVPKVSNTPTVPVQQVGLGSRDQFIQKKKSFSAEKNQYRTPGSIGMQQFYSPFQFGTPNGRENVLSGEPRTAYHLSAVAGTNNPEHLQGNFADNQNYNASKSKNQWTRQDYSERAKIQSNSNSRRLFDNSPPNN